MKEKDFRGDTFFRSYTVDFDNEAYKFIKGDIVRAVFVKEGQKYLEKTIEVASEQDQVDIRWEAEEMATLEIGSYILEVEISTNVFVKTGQEQIYVSKDHIVGDYDAEN